MTNQKKVVEKYVLETVNKYAWSFDELYQNRESFVHSFIEYNKDICNLEVIDLQIFSGHFIEIQYRGALPSEEYESLKYVVSSAETDNESASGISFFDLMYQFNNGAFPYLEDVGHHFYEGLNFIDVSDTTLHLSMHLGS